MFGADGILYLLGGAVIAALIAFFKGRLDGAKAERNRNRAKEADAYEKHLKDIADAGNARPHGLPVDDPYNRDPR